ncbi:hypothetical protein ES703_30886 [subsurface metagenome]
MALIKYGIGIADARGSVGGVVLSKNSTSHYMRTRTIPVNPRSTVCKLNNDHGFASQSKIRAAMAALTVRWSTVLTNDERLSWELYATNVTVQNKLGEAIKLSGMNHYLRCNVIRYAHYSSAFDAGPTTFEIPEQDPTLIFQPEVHEQKCKITFDDTMAWVDEDLAAMQIWMGRPQNAQRTFYGGPYLGIKDKAGKSVGPITSPEWMTNIFQVTAGQKVWYKVRIRRADGRISDPFYKSAIVVAGPIP